MSVEGIDETAENNEAPNLKEFLNTGRFIEAEQIFGDAAVMDETNRLIDAGNIEYALKIADRLGYYKEAERAAALVRDATDVSEEALVTAKKYIAT